jgi:uncharacterized protein
MATAGTKNSVFRDSVFPGRLIDVPEKVRQVIDTPAFQRLRGIRQLGLASYVFPSGEHSRFAHSIGVYGTAGLVFDGLKARAKGDYHLHFDDDERMQFTIAALCHDIGHTAFSHVLESTLLPSPHRHHETVTAELIYEDQHLRDAINKIADIDAIIFMIDGTHMNNALSRLVSGPFDVDRCDYLLRDALMTGVEYGRHDLIWLTHALSVRPNRLFQPVLVLDGPRGVDSMRHFLSARRDMHRHVYFHPTIRAAQLHLKAIFNRLQDIPSKKIKAHIPTVFHGLVFSNSVSLPDFLGTTDAEVLAMIRNLAGKKIEPMLDYLCGAFIRRQFPKCVLDAGRQHTALSKLFRIDFTDPSVETPVLEEPTLFELMMPEERITKLAPFIADCREFVSKREAAMGWPKGIAQYLVTAETVSFNAGTLGDVGFSFNNQVMPFEQIKTAGSCYEMGPAMEDFSFFRLFAPREVKSDLAAHIEDKYRIKTEPRS